jgi:hypothetical protein
VGRGGAVGDNLRRQMVEITTHADPLYQHLIVNAERKF